MPIALYYKALLTDFVPDLALIQEKEILRFHSDYPTDASGPTWYALNAAYPASPESIEARLRLAIRYAGTNNIEYARRLVKDALDMIPCAAQGMAVAKDTRASYLTVFAPPPASALTPFKLSDLEFRLRRFQDLISEQNLIPGDDGSRLRLADFVLMNPYARDYKERLDALARKIKPSDPLADNVALALAVQVADPCDRARRLKEIAESHPDSDGGTEAMYELGRLKVSIWRETPAAEAEKKLEMLADSRATLMKFIQLYGGSVLAERARTLLQDLPSLESAEAELRPSSAAKPK
jgi:hypothetical protein